MIDLGLWFFDLAGVSNAVRNEAISINLYTEFVDTQKNASAILSTLNNKGAGLASGLELLTTKVNELVKKVEKTIDSRGNLQYLHLGCVNGGLLGLEKGDNAVAAGFGGLLSGSALVSGPTKQNFVANITAGLESVAQSKNGLGDVFDKVHGRTGTLLSVSARMLLVIQSFKELSEALKNCATTMSNKSGADQLAGLIKGFKSYSDAQDYVAEKLERLING